MLEANRGSYVGEQTSSDQGKLDRALLAIAELRKEHEALIARIAEFNRCSLERSGVPHHI